MTLWPLRSALFRVKPTQRVFGLAGVLCLLAACAIAPDLPRQERVAQWSGRLGLRVDGDPPASYSAGFNLQGSPASGELLLTSPLGTTLATLRWDHLGAELRQGGTTTQRTSLQELSADLGGGTALPVAALFGWLNGEAHAADGWQVDLSNHANGRVTAQRSKPLPTAELRLVFER